MELTIRDEFIKLGQAMKLADLVDNGAMAKEAIASGSVLVNGQTETRRGRKCRAGDVIEWEGNKVIIRCL